MSVIWGYTGEPDEITAKSMAASLRHRYRSESVKAVHRADCHLYYAGPETAGGAYADGGACIVYSGRFYGNASQHTPRSLLEAWRANGESMLLELSGAYTIAIMDGNQLTLIRDGAGHRAIYYGSHGKRTYFASETKAILATPNFPRQIRPAAAAQYLAYSFVPDGGSMLKGIHDLPAGHLVHLKNGTIQRPQEWFDLGLAHTKDATQNEVGEYVRKAVQDRIPTEPFAVYLSGGLDSSLIAAEIKRQVGRPIPSYTIHFGPKYGHELAFAKEVAGHIGTDHHEVEIAPKTFLPRLREMIWKLDTPIGDPITMPNYELGRIVSNDVSTIFNGEGGDPLFGGPKNFAMLLHHWYGGLERPPRFREKAYLASYRRAYSDLEQLLNPDFLELCNLPDSLEAPLTPFFEHQSRSLLDKLMAINTRLKGAHLILPKVERMAAASGLTVYSPLFDDRLIRASFRLPGDQKLAKGIEKVVLKELYRDQLPSSVINRPKSGMRVPVHYWFQGDLKRYAKKILHPKALETSGTFNPKRVQQYLQYAEGPGLGRYGLRLWMILTLELYNRIIIQNETV